MWDSAFHCVKESLTFSQSDELEIITRTVERHGPKWRIILNLFPGKSFEKESHNIKQRVHSAQNYYQSKNEKRKIPFLVAKRDQNSTWEFFWSTTLELWVFSLLLLSHNHFIKPKAEKEKYLFLLNKNPLLEKSDPELKRGGFY